MDGYEMQPHRHLYELFPLAPNARVVKNEIVYTIEVAHFPVKKQAKFVTGYFFELIMLTGDPSQPQKLRVQSDTSPIYHFKSKLTGTCEMRLPLPNSKTPWMVLLKVCCTEGDVPLMEAVHSGMKVMKVNSLEAFSK